MRVTYRGKLSTDFSRELIVEDVNEQPRTITDPQSLRALGHPVRLALLEALLAGPLTATQAGEILGESPTTCSFHLRQLAKYGFVEEAGGGPGRTRPWRLTHTGWRAPAQPDNPDFTRAVQALDHVLLDRLYARIRRFVDSVATYPAEWQQAATGETSYLHVTAEELRELLEEHKKVNERFRERWAERNEHADRRPEGTLPVEILIGGYPI
jgi:predicted ArsR family transcriptional regulator